MSMWKEGRRGSEGGGGREAHLIERDLLRLSTNSSHTSPVLSLQASLDRSEFSEGGSNGSKDISREAVVRKEHDGSEGTEGGGELSGEDDEVEHWLSHVSVEGGESVAEHGDVVGDKPKGGRRGKRRDAW